jgi:hypothetical protein
MAHIARLMARHVIKGERTEVIGREVIALRDAFRTIGFCIGAGQSPSGS